MSTLALLVIGVVRTASPQDPVQQILEQKLGRPVTEAQIIERIEASGLTHEEARQRLVQSGYDPSLLDPYFAAMSTREEAGAKSAAANADIMAALAVIGAAAPDPNEAQEQKPDEAADEAEDEDDAASGRTASSAGGEPAVFGRSIFRGSGSQFQVVTTGPVDPDYRLGPGDEIVLVLTGDVELIYTLNVTREGYIVIPDVGHVSVNGLSLSELEDHLYTRLGRVYSGVRRGPEATTHFSVSLGRLRTNQVYLIGEVERPGAYQISSVATVFNALYNAGGPNGAGSFRSIEVRRGGRVIRRVDLYSYLLRGESEDDIRLEQGDIVHVPLSGPRITVLGNVRRPAIFELTREEDLRDAIRFAGGFQPDAFVQRIQIDRILPPEERRPGRERVLVDVNLAHLLEDSLPVRVRAGDIVRIFGISDDRRNRVTIRGEVFRPGVYEYTHGLTLWNLITRAEGLLPDAYRPVAHVIRVDPVNGTHDLRRVSLAQDSAGRPVEDLELLDLDEIVIYGRAALQTSRTVEVAGPVKEPGTYPFADGMTLKDLILTAGGMEDDFLPDRVHLYRLDETFTEHLIRYELDPDPIGIPQQEIPLRDKDRVILYSRQQLLVPRDVSIHGFVKQEGTYPLADGMTVNDLLLAAGGFQEGADHLEVEVARRPPGYTRTRELTTIYRVPLSAASFRYHDSRMQGAPPDPETGSDGDGGSGIGRSDNGGRHEGRADWRPDPTEFELSDGDQIFVRRLPGYEEPTRITVAGEVVYPGEYALQQRRERISSLIHRAGGVTDEAYLKGARLIRDDTPVGISLEAALRDPGGPSDLMLKTGDRIEVPEYEPTVLVRGAVAFESKVAFRQGKGLNYYIAQAGGYLDEADRSRIAVTHQSGERDIADRFLIFTLDPAVRPGSTIDVPLKPVAERGGFDIDRFLTRALTILSTTATLLLAVDRIAPKN